MDRPARVLRHITAGIAIVVSVSIAFPGDAVAWPVTDHTVASSVVEAFDPSIVRQMALTIAPADWDTIRRDRTYDIYVPATLSIDGVPLASNVMVRRKSGLALPSARDPQKVALKIDIAGVNSSQRWMGLSKLSLEAAARTSPISEGLAWLVHQAASTALGYGTGYDAGMAAWVTMSVNGRNLGVYLSVEQRNKTFLQNRSLFVSGQTWLYKQDGNVITELETGSGNSPRSSLLCFQPFGLSMDRCAPPVDDAALSTLLDAEVDMRSLLAMSAVNAFLANKDSFFGIHNNYYFLDATWSGAPLRRFYPWDTDWALDRNFSNVNTNVFAITHAASRRGGAIKQTQAEQLILNHPAYRTMYRDILTALMADGQPLSLSYLMALVDQVETLMRPYLRADPYVLPMMLQSVDRYFVWLRGFLTARVPIVQSQLAANLPAPRP